MHPSKRNVLVVGVSPDEFRLVEPLLGRNGFELDRFPSGAGALELTSAVPVDVLIVRCPLPDVEMRPFLDGVRREGNPCRRSSVVLLTDPDHVREAQTLIGRGANRMVVLGESEDTIETAVSELLDVSPRKEARFFARIEVKLGGAKDLVLCQTENVSASGLLIKTDRRWEKGTEIHFEFTIPSDPRPIGGVAEVVRHTMIGRDGVGGVGLRFVSFAGDSQRRFDAWRQQL